MFFLTNSQSKTIFILILVAIISGLFWSYRNLGNTLPLSTEGDAGFYNRLAVDILEGRSAVSYERETQRTAIEPLYPYFLAGIYSVFGKNYNTVIFAQLFFYCLVILVVYLIAKRVVEEKLAFLTAVLVALFYPLVEWVGILNREMLFIFFLIFFVYCLYKARDTLKLQWFIFAGIACASASLTNKIIQFIPLFIIFGFWAVFGKAIFQRRVIIKTTLFFVIAFILPTIFFLSNNLQRESFNATSSIFLSRKAQLMRDASGQYLDHFVGLTLGYYFSEKINPNVRYKLFIDDIKAADDFVKMRESGDTYQKIADEIFSREYNYLLVNPHKFLAATFLDFLQFNGPMIVNPLTLAIGPMQNLFIKGTHPEIPPAGKVAILIILRLFYWMFVWFVIYGLVKAVREWRKFIWILLIILYFNLVYSAVFGLPRYAIPIYPFYILLFVMGATTAWNKYVGYNAKKCESICEMCER